MNELNYKVEIEQIIIENNKYYNLILFTEGTKRYSKKYLFVEIFLVSGSVLALLKKCSRWFLARCIGKSSLLF